MPRNGKGQKIQTAGGQEYGAVAAQEEAQATVPLAAAPAPPKPGAAGGFNRPSERPDEPVTAPSGAMPTPPQDPDDPQRRFRAAMQLPILEQMASQRGASPHLRNSVRKLKAYIGDTSEFADRNP